MADRSFPVADVEVEKSYVLRLFDLWDIGRETCIPAIVESYDRDTHFAKVKPLSTHVKREDGESVSFARESVEVPVWHICHGGVNIDSPLFRGDTGWLIAGDRNSGTAIEANRAVLTEDQKDFRTEVKKGEKFQGDGEPIDLNASGEPTENKGIKDVDNMDRNKFVFGFFLPASWMHGGLKNEDGFCVSYTPKDDDESKPCYVNMRKDRILVQRGKDDAEGTDRIVIDDKGIRYEGKPDRTNEVVTAIRYDVTTHQFQIKTVTQSIRGDFVVGVSEESDWTMMEGGQAVPESTSNG